MASQSAFKIEKGVAIPPAASNTTHASPYPFTSMDVGDSFFVETDERALVQRKITGAASYQKTAYGRKSPCAGSMAESASGASPDR